MRCPYLFYLTFCADCDTIETEGGERMKKEALKLSNIKADLKRMADFYMSNRVDFRLTYIVPIAIIAVMLGILTKRVWVGLLIFSLSSIELIRFARDLRAHRNTMRMISAAIERGDISISVETLSHIAREVIYEPNTASHGNPSYGDETKTVTFFYFEGGGSWRVPSVEKHYSWSQDYYMSQSGLENTSTQGEQFFFICLQGYYDIAYIYPCDRFELGDLKTGREDGAESVK